MGAEAMLRWQQALAPAQQGHSPRALPDRRREPQPSGPHLAAPAWQVVDIFINCQRFLWAGLCVEGSKEQSCRVLWAEPSREDGSCSSQETQRAQGSTA